MDFVAQMNQLPVRGETLNGWGFQMLPGGKGANQACAAGRLGGCAKMVGRVGRDIFADQQRTSLGAAGVDTTFVLTTEGEATGVALIFVEKGGQNMIVIAPGANRMLTPRDLHTASELFESGYLLLQLEIPLETVEAAAALGRSRGMVTILDPAPARPLPGSLLRQVDLLTPNETEALALLDLPTRDISVPEAKELARLLLARGPRQIILKLGAKGVWFQDQEVGRHFPAPTVEAVDATAAGDTFNGSLAVALAEGLPMEDAISFANCAAALSVTKLGAQASIPDRRELEAFMHLHPSFSGCPTRQL
jgi:ribokinase